MENLWLSRVAVPFCVLIFAGAPTSGAPTPGAPASKTIKSNSQTSLAELDALYRDYSLDKRRSLESVLATATRKRLLDRTLVRRAVRVMAHMVQHKCILHTWSRRVQAWNDSEAKESFANMYGGSTLTHLPSDGIVSPGSRFPSTHSTYNPRCLWLLSLTLAYGIGAVCLIE